MKILYPATKKKIKELYSKEGFSKDELLTMYKDYYWRDILKALRGIPKAKRI